ncbi:hypothetical protein AYL99_03353 [Fonsecaea erecta]|uniref:Protein kinase domain-containing protein n=1 Tax=Fonsecaea erecta TaxID=1367422 RepID=A0A178ZNC6_9EURO|nr:hypothetical protein AYL99_03353 [Fonsecaea erecta]OAP61152.1 hypothetical protein AYL99_03353 [Fonsecaea erecta]
MTTKSERRCKHAPNKLATATPAKHAEPPDFGNFFIEKMQTQLDSDPNGQVNPAELTESFREQLGSTLLEQRVATFAHQPSTAGRLKIGDLLFLWQHIPARGISMRGSRVKRAGTVLEAFCEAWKAITPVIEDLGKFEDLKNMAMIAITLNKIHQGPGYFDQFLHWRWTDRFFPFDRSKLGTVFYGSTDALRVENLFFNKQYQIKWKEWPEGAHATFEESEPLPFTYDSSERSEGSYSIVDRVRDLSCYPSIPQVYARKCSKGGSASRKHIEDEVKTLKRLRHHHIVRYVKSYERGEDEFAFLATPAARQTLLGLLEQYRCTANDCANLKPILLRAFGCISLGVDYLHNAMAIRHRDIKPENILYHDGSYFIADFGLAYHFHHQIGSGTYRRFRATYNYRAPENGSATEPHGRASDVFSLGCTFLEILSTMIKSETGEIRELRIYAEHLDDVRRWVKNASSEDRGRKEPLRSLLKLANDMVVEEAEKRPNVRRVIAELQDISSKSKSSLFCDECRTQLTANLTLEHRARWKRWIRGLRPQFGRNEH